MKNFKNEFSQFKQIYPFPLSLSVFSELLPLEYIMQSCNTAKNQNGV